MYFTMAITHDIGICNDLRVSPLSYFPAFIYSFLSRYLIGTTVPSWYEAKLDHQATEAVEQRSRPSPSLSKLLRPRVCLLYVSGSRTWTSGKSLRHNRQITGLYSPVQQACSTSHWRVLRLCVAQGGLISGVASSMCQYCNHFGGLDSTAFSFKTGSSSGKFSAMASSRYRRYDWTICIRRD